jgi:hypothetical protein
MFGDVDDDLLLGGLEDKPRASPLSLDTAPSSDPFAIGRSPTKTESKGMLVSRVAVIKYRHCQI